MKKVCFIFILISLLVSCKSQTRDDIIQKNAAIDTNAVIVPGNIHPLLTKLITQINQLHHYNKVKLNDSISVEIYKNYIDALDNNKMYFLESDIKEFEKEKKSFDDILSNGNLDLPFKIFNVYKNRLKERFRDCKQILLQEFDYSQNESVVLDREKENWVKTESELYDIWRLRLKNDALNLKLSNKDWANIQKTLLKRYESYKNVILRYRDEDVFQLFMNAVGMTFDPHTNYFSPKLSEDFKINMRLSLEGIGATLRLVDDYTTIVELVAGGPAKKSGKLNPNDKIVGVGQGDDGEIVDVIGWRTDDVVELIRGPKDTKVRLEILPAESTPTMPTKFVTLVRDKIKLEEQAASKEIIDIEENGKKYHMGIIKIPSFYSDFEARAKGDKNFKSTTKDVKRLLEELKKEKVDGVLIDLRNNGGGALQEAIELTGLFIKDGPVVQVKNSDGSIEEGNDPDPQMIYDGPLAVLINKSSASASEIFSSAIQDYGRGIIVGNNSYGKGTVQNLIDLDRFIRNGDNKSGQLKLTIAKYYRITGSTTQHKGVKPDVEFPDLYDADEFGESSYPSALPWDLIKSAPFQKYNDFSNIIPKLNQLHKQRVEKNLEFKFIMQDIKEYKELKNRKAFSLNENDRKTEREKGELKKKQRENEREKFFNISKPSSPEIKVKDIRVDDPFLEESSHILANLITLKK